MISTALQVSREIDKRLKKASKILGFDENALAERALIIYLDSFEKRLDLKKEFKGWDKISDDDFAAFEGNL